MSPLAAHPETMRAEPSSSPADRIAERFLPEHMQGELIEAEHLVRYVWAAGYAKGREVLDAGCGAGYGARLLLGEGAKRYVGIDVAEEVVRAAQERYRDDPATEFQVGDVTDLPFEDATFDAVICFETLEHLSNQPDALREVKRVLRADGLLLASSPNRLEYPPGNPHHARELSHDEFLALLSEVFANVAPLRQHNWLASAILGDPDFTGQEPERSLRASLRKTAGRDPGAELYTLAICSDEPPPDQSQAVMMTHALEVRRWLEQIDRARNELLVQGDELRQAREGLAAAELELLQLRDKTSRVIAHAEQRTYWLDRAQIDLDRLAQRRWVRVAYRVLRALRSIRALLRKLTAR